FVENSLYNISGASAGNILDLATWLRSGLTPVVAGETFIITGLVGGGNVSISFFNSDTPSGTSYLSPSILPGYPPDPVRLYSFTVPEDAVFMGFNLGKNEVYSFSQMKNWFKVSRNQSFN